MPPCVRQWVVLSTITRLRTMLGRQSQPVCVTRRRGRGGGVNAGGTAPASSIKRAPAGFLPPQVLRRQRYLLPRLRPAGCCCRQSQPACVARRRVRGARSSQEAERQQPLPSADSRLRFATGAASLALPAASPAAGWVSLAAVAACRRGRAEGGGGEGGRAVSHMPILIALAAALS